MRTSIFAIVRREMECMQGTPPDQDTITATTAVMPVNPAPATPLVTPSKRLPTALALL